MEATGIVLAVLPLVSSAIKQYGTLYKAYSRYRKCQTGVNDLLEGLRIQRIIFTNETKQLLVCVVSCEDADSMIKDTSHALWDDADIASRVELMLGECKAEFVLAAQRVYEKMKGMQNELDRCSPEGNKEVTGNAADRDWKKRLLRKFKYTISESKLAAMTVSIRDATTDYCILRKQVQEHEQSRATASRHDRPSEELRRIQATQVAARHVYEVLATACRIHHTHSAHLSLRSRYITQTANAQIEFKIACHDPTQHLQLHQNGNSFCCVVDSILQQPPPATSGNLQIRVSMNTPLITGSLGSVNPLGDLRGALPQTEVNQNQATIQTNITNASLQPQAQGPNQLPRNWECRFYPQIATSSASDPSQSSVPSGPEITCGPRHPRSLDAILDAVRYNSGAEPRLTVLQRLRLAKIVSAATLNLHATPWLPTGWTSQDILVYDLPMIHRANQPVADPEAFLNVSVQQGFCQTVQSSPADGLASLAKNLSLYNLGVVLLELAFEKPLRELCGSSATHGGSPSQEKCFNTALRKSKEVSTCLGLKYADIVKRCLYCDFDGGDDLDTLALQKAVFRTVITELESLENGFCQLGVV